mmetsp:Transcript_7255/g.9401  ORF Transcript_7255/g.9401 Transcript_7255/m.9401 type:complete len:647 (+) Transcript_7255:128-2068(+)
MKSSLANKSITMKYACHLLLSIFVWNVPNIDGFVTSHRSVHQQPTNLSPPSSSVLFAESTDDISGDMFLEPDDNGDDNDNDDYADDQKIVIRPKGMIDLGSLGRYSDDEVSSLNEQVREEVTKSFDESFQRLESAKQKIKEDAELSKESARKLSEQRLEDESRRFNARTDSLIDNFLQKTKSEREATKMAASADKRMAGKGLDVGVWGVDEYGRAVVTNSDGTGFSAPKALLNKGLYGVGLGLNGGDDAYLENSKVLFVTSDNPDPIVQGIVLRLTDMLRDSDYPIETVTSSCKLARIGGSDATTCIILPDAADDRTKMNQLVDRIRTPTASTVNGPPSHIVYLQGTSQGGGGGFLQAMFGGDDKVVEAEESLKSTVKLKSSPFDSPLQQEAAEYTIIKVGKLVKDSSLNKAKIDERTAKAALDGQVRVALMPGDALNMDTGVNDVANVIYQSILLQPAARNSTFSVSSFPSGSAEANQEQWDDLFLKLAGPELVRINIPPEQNFGELAAFIEQWAKLFETSPASKTGLTTPVKVTRSKTLPNTYGIEIKFKSTNTGDNYKTSKEDRQDEKLRDGYAKSPSPSRKSNVEVKNPRKEGGIEILVEQYPSFRVRARRCNMDEKTTIKEMSEGVILKRLRKDLTYYLNR